MEICREVKNSEFLEGWSGRNAGIWRIDAELKKRQVDHSAPWPSSWLRPSFFLLLVTVALLKDNPSWLADRRSPAPLAITQVVRISEEWQGLL